MLSNKYKNKTKPTCWVATKCYNQMEGHAERKEYSGEKCKNNFEVRFRNMSDHVAWV
jgi:hypothetical protein